MKASLMGMLAVSGTVLAGAVGIARAQDAALAGARAPEARTIYIWTGGGGSASTVGNWGNGSATAGNSAAGDGGLTIRTRNFYEGARFDINPPIDLEPYRQAGFLRLRVRFPNAGGRGGRGNRGNRGGGFPGGGGQPGASPEMGAASFSNQMQPHAIDGTDFDAMPLASNGANPLMETRRWAQFGAAAPPIQGPGGGFAPGANFPGGMVPGMAPGMPPGMMPPVQPSAPVAQIQQMQLILMREKGAMIGRFDVQPADSQGGRTYAIALGSLQSTPDAAGRVRRIVLTGDQDGTFSLDQFALVVESNRMIASIRRAQDAPGMQLNEIEVRPGPLTLVADVESGIADASVEWNFDADTSGSLPPPAPAVAAPGTLPNIMGQPGLMNPNAMPPGMMGGAPAGVLPAPIGPRIDARGLIGRFEYPNEEQNYRVEITVRDRANRKPPVKSSIIVKVRSG